MKKVFTTLLLIGIFTISSFSQTGYYNLGDPQYGSYGRAIVRSNDGNIITGTGYLANNEFRKITSEGNVIWTANFEGITNFDWAMKVFPVPGEGYYCFSGYEYYHVSEDGEDLYSNSYMIGLDLGYADSLYLSPFWFYINDVSFTGEYFDLIGRVEDDNGFYHLVLFRINKAGEIIFNHMFDVNTMHANGLIKLLHHDGFDYLVFQADDFLAGDDSLHIQKINLTDFSVEDQTFYPPFRVEGIIDKEDGIILYGEKSTSGIDSLIETVAKWDYSGAMEWWHTDTIYYGNNAKNLLQNLVEMPDGNLLGIYSMGNKWDFDSVLYRLQYFTSEGELFNTSPVFYKLKTDNTGDYLSRDVEGLIYYGPNLIGILGEQVLDGLNGQCFLLFTDTTGNYFHYCVTGKLFNDANDNSIYDADEFIFHDRQIHTEPGSYYAFSNENGDYSMLIGKNDDYSIITDSIDYWDVISPADHYSISADTSLYLDTLGTYNFMYDYTTPVHDISVTTYQSSISPGYDSYNTIVVENIGNQMDESGNATIQFPSALFPESMDPADGTLSDTTITWSYSNLDPFSPIYFDADYNTDPGIIPGTLLTTVGNIQPDISDADISNNSDTVVVSVYGAWDPNHLTVSPTGTGPEGDIDQETEWLTYTIEFQNVGNAAAQNINIYDTLDTFLNMSEVEMLAASHTYTLFLSPEGILHWKFDSIMLPDSLSDFIGSMGFVKFRVRISDDAEIGDQIHNVAGIYFDYNLPVITNTTIITLTDKTTFIEEQSVQEMNVNPNPADKYITFNFVSNLQSATSLRIIDIHGRVIGTIPIEPGVRSQTLDISHLPEDVYYGRLIYENNEEGNATPFIIIH